MNWRRFFVVIGVVAIVLLAYISRNEIKMAFELIKQANLLILLFVPLIQLLSFLANAMYYQSFLNKFGYPVKLGSMYKLSLGVNFVNQILPAGGMAGVTFITYALKSEHVPTAKATLAQLGRYVLTFVSFSIVLVAGLVMLYFGGSIQQILVRVTVILVALSIGLSVAFLFAMNSKDRFNALALWVQRVIDWVGAKFRATKRPLIGKQRAQTALNEFHEGYEMIVRERSKFGWPFFYAFMGNVFEVSTLYIVFLALGVQVNPGAMIISYASATATGAVSLIPGDIGVYEATMVAVLTASGIPVALGISATLLYRLLNKATFLPIGFYYYSKFINAHPQAKRAIDSIESEVHHG